MKRASILLLGFSCTDTEDGYAAFLEQKLKEVDPSILISRCGLGGLAPPIIPAVLRTQIESGGRYTHVLLEISTSIYQWLETTTPGQARDVIRDIIYTALSLGIRPCFLMLHRVEATTPFVNLNEIIREESIRSRTDYIDLSRNMDQIFGRGWFDRHYRDAVHTNEAGGRAHASYALPQLLNILDHDKYDKMTFALPTEGRRAASVAELTGLDAAGTFRRKSYERPYVILKEKEQITVKFPEPRRAMAVTFIMGPWSGSFYMELSGEIVKKLNVNAFDERSYYPRLGLRTINGYAGSDVKEMTFSFSSRCEEVALIKGKRNPYPAEIRLVDIIILDRY